ncbi:hypothetical protein KOR34_16790 [Posidoniimonas corsicana]|uniref:SpoIIAA-like protein n=1 Tax=Posidoniimonas corsicana TaxID=1938618 RepID=A0A5C5VFQ3_9BACT|nr:STAS/SEC14 domain-containing protein [Posidoniimonas corsicana]TWT36739.1 hypothetical protein KOR34_16790 [Posidoniimonas corsicana]
MLEHTLDAQRGVLYLTPHGPLAAEDFQRVAAEVDPLIADHDLNGLMIAADKFPGWSDFAALSTHLRFVREHHKHIRRVAIVSDDSLLSTLPSVASHFVAAEVKHFPSADRAEADAWLQAAG